MNKPYNNKPDNSANPAIEQNSEGDTYFDVIPGAALNKDSYRHHACNRLGAQELSLETEAVKSAWTPYGIDAHHATPINAGYNPYSHAAQAPVQRVKKRHLRELSRWIELKQRMAGKQR